MNISQLKVAALAAAISAAVAMLPSAPARAADQAAAKKPDPMQIARGAKAWADNCGRCHNLRDPKEFTNGDWETIMSQMRVRANLPGDVARDITAFLKASH